MPQPGGAPGRRAARRHALRRPLRMDQVPGSASWAAGQAARRRGAGLLGRQPKRLHGRARSGRPDSMPIGPAPRRAAGSRRWSVAAPRRVVPPSVSAGACLADDLDLAALPPFNAGTAGPGPTAPNLTWLPDALCCPPPGGGDRPDRPVRCWPFLPKLHFPPPARATSSAPRPIRAGPSAR